MNRLIARLAVVLVVVTSLAAVDAAAGQGAIQIGFQFVRGTNTSSSITLMRRDRQTGKVYNSATWRAGSGQSRNDCATAVGWLPSGFYAIVQHSDSYAGTKIRGRVWQLSDKICSGGAQTLRTELFIHSEETSSRGQVCGPAGTDFPFCWEGPNDYYSEGCIKLSHTDVAAADADWHAWGGVAGPNKLYVS